MDKKILLSIIIPTFNSAKTLSHCLSSIARQAFDNCEVLIMDAVSSDETLIIANSYSTEIQRLTIFSEPDKGTYDAMNMGIARAQGTWLYFMGSDDTFWDDKVLQRIFYDDNLLQQSDLLYGDVYSKRLGGRYDGPFSVEKILNNSICHQAIFYRKILFSKLGMYNIKYRISADWDFNLRCFLDPGIRIKYIDFVIANFADGGLSTTNPHDETHWKDRISNILKYDKRVLKKSKKGLYKGELALQMLTEKKSSGYKHLVYTLIFSDHKIYFLKSALLLTWRNLLKIL